ncbi:FAD-binding domain-containing protein [Pluteus cervinus]|uniref:FAD-binding domain-containing protein n=1 Tax=Pluteus cervinus TaxID=181527 RepID=A0ACD3AJL3_9AGAR|nr:FAD-binding domain-containing protein [Pluteus cervinus]
MRFSRPCWTHAFAISTLILSHLDVAQATWDLNSANSTCTKLVSQLGSALVVQTGPVYMIGVESAWSSFNSIRRPSCIVYPRTSTHVQVAMRAIYRDNVHYAVQSGGHSAMRGWNTVDDGVLIHFRFMKNVSYDAIKDTVTLEPGVRWGEATAALQPFGVTTPGGRLGDIGTGLLLGGGLSYFSPAYGFSADLLKEADVVLVDGRLVTATATNQYSDLFRALKGGANRFGIVTRYEMYAIHTGPPNTTPFYGGLIIYPEAQAEALLNATARYVRDVHDPNAAMLIALTFSNTNGAVVGTHMVTLFYRGTSLPAEVFGDFLRIPNSLNRTSPIDYTQACNLLGPGDDRGHGQLFGASAFSGDVGLYHNAYLQFKNFSTTFKSSLNGTVLAFTPIPESQTAAGRQRGGNAIDAPLRNYAAVQFYNQFVDDLTSVPGPVENGRQLVLSRMPRSPGLPLYINECDSKQNAFSTYGGYDFLKRTYKKYDPTRFNVRFTDGPIGL